LQKILDRNNLVLRKFLTYLFWLFVEDHFLVPAVKRNIELRKNNKNMFFNKVEFGMKTHGIYDKTVERAKTLYQTIY
jgi:hypothetical protein